MVDSKEQIKKMWKIFAVGTDSVLEIRAIKPRGDHGFKPPKVRHYRVKDFLSVDHCKEAFENDSLQLNEEGYNIYTVMNPIRPDFNGPGAAKDADILYRDLLLIDIDRVGDTSCPASQIELDAAKSLADQIREYLSESHWPTPVVVMSGNGYHIYYVMGELPNDESGTALVRTTLNTLSENFNNAIVGVDTTVFNAARITKVPGTIMRKGEETCDRPYRRAYVCDE